MEFNAEASRVVTGRDPDETRAGLERWFRTRGHTDPVVTLLPSPEASGYSHETVVFELAEGGQPQRLVARVEPNDLSVFPNPDLGIEYRLLERISHSVAVPALVGHEPDAGYLGTAFYVMEHIDGQVPGDNPPYPIDGWLHQLSPEERAAVWWSGLETMAAAHAVDWKGLGLEFVNRGRPLGLAGELAYWDAYFAFAAADGLGPVQQRAWDWLRANAPDGEVALCWGDSRIGNQMFDGTRCVALLDWEMACLSDPTQDLAWYCHFEELFTEGLGVPKLEGMPETGETIARYEELTGHPVRNFGYFHVFAALRFAVILERLGHLQIATGKLPADSTFPTDNFAIDHLALLCDRNGI